MLCFNFSFEMNAENYLERKSFVAMESPRHSSHWEKTARVGRTYQGDWILCVTQHSSRGLHSVKERVLMPVSNTLETELVLEYGESHLLPALQMAGCVAGSRFVFQENSAELRVHLPSKCLTNVCIKEINSVHQTERRDIFPLVKIKCIKDI